MEHSTFGYRIDMYVYVMIECDSSVPFLRPCTFVPVCNQVACTRIVRPKNVVITTHGQVTRFTTGTVGDDHCYQSIMY